jgi:hypothetical protein
MPRRYAFVFLLAVIFGLPAQAQAPLYGITACCPSTVVTFDLATGVTTPIVEIGEADDAFPELGAGALDPTTRQLYLVRNDTLIAADLDAGTVAEIGSAEGFLPYFAGFDTGRGRIYALTTAVETTDPETGAAVITYRLAAVDPADATTEEVAVVGGGRFDGTTYEGDVFSTVAAPAIASPDPLRLFANRNFELLTVALPSGELTESASFTPWRLLSYAPSSGGLLFLEADYDEGYPGPLTFFVRERDPVTGEVLTEVVAGSAEVEENGAYEGDVFYPSFGQLVFDAAGDRVVFNRNGRLLVVDLADGLVTEGPALGNVRVVGVPLSVATDADVVVVPASVEVASYPNPFREAARLTVTLDRPQTLEIAAFDLLGRRVAVLHRGPVPAGTFTLVDVGRALPAGTYVVRVRGESVRQSLRITRLD